MIPPALSEARGIVRRLKTTPILILHRVRVPATRQVDRNRIYHNNNTDVTKIFGYSIQ